MVKIVELDFGKANCNLKGVTTLKIPAEYSAALFDGATIKGNTIIMTVGPDKYTLTNCDSLQSVYFKTGENYDEEHNKLTDILELLDYMVDARGGVTGSGLSDKIDKSGYIGEKGLKINAGKGDDTITGSAHDDTITGGAGQNMVKYSGGKDTIMLTKGEDFILDLTGKAAPTYSIDKTDLIVNVDNGNSFRLKNFAKTDVTGTGNVRLTRDNGANYVNLNSDVLFNFNENALVTNEKKKTGILTGTRLGDNINLDVTGLEDYKLTVKAGAGNNVINLDVAKLGNLTLAEERVNAVNNIVFNETNPVFGNYTLSKAGNDLIMSDGQHSSFTMSSFFSTGGKYATTLFNGKNLSEKLNEWGTRINITGSGMVKGSDYADDIYTADSEIGYTGKPKADKIYAGKGDDIINAGGGKNQIYVFKGDGADTIQNGNGEDTIVFAKNTSINIGYAETGNVTEGGEEIYDLRICYGDNNTDYINIQGAVTFDGWTYHFDPNATSVKALKVGNKTYTMDSLLNRNQMENPDPVEGLVAGTDGHDDIYINDAEKFNNNANVTISGGLGNDNIMIGSNWAEDNGEVINNTGNYNMNPEDYDIVDITPTVYTHTTDGAKDTTLGTYDRVVSYASNDGIYWAQSAISHMQVYGWHSTQTGTNDTYHTYYNNQYTKICDEAGVDDALYIEDMSHNDLKVLFTISKDYEDFATAIAGLDKNDAGYNNDMVSAIKNSLQEVKFITASDRDYFFEDPDGNAVGIDIDYWGDKGLDDDDDAQSGKAQKLLELSHGTLGKFGSGVEKIYTNDGYYTTSADIATVAASVADWLNNDATYGGQFDSVEDVLMSGTPEALASVMAVFDTLAWHQQA